MGARNAQTSVHIVAPMMRASLGVVSLCVFTLFAACDDGSGQSEEILLSSQAPKPKIDLKDPTSTLSHTSTQPWLLAKTGAVNTTASTVTWSINATQGPAGARRLVVAGSVTIRNTGGAAAPVGNIVVQLQSKSGTTWTTRSADVANATFGDTATAVRVVTGNAVTTITENTASGALSVPLVPQLTIGANSSVPINFTASFNNDVLGIAVGTVVRAEILVTFGNAGGGNNPANVDINGNGVIDASEARVDGVSALLGEKLVPAAAATTTPVTLSDTLADITTTGTATFTNAVFTIGQTTGSVQLSYDGGVDGGTIRNCAHLTGTGINLETCSTQIIAPEPFQWMNGDVVTYRQSDWGAVPNGSNAASLLTGNFAAVYAVTPLRVGGVFTILFSAASAVLSYLPASGVAGALNTSLVDPTTSSSGLFGGEVVALKLNVDFADAALTGATFSTAFGDLVLCNFTSPSTINGTSVRDFLAATNALLGSGTATFTISDAVPIIGELNAAFLGGTPTGFALDHVCP